MTKLPRFALWSISAISLQLLLSACASTSQQPCSAPSVAPRAIPPLSKAAKQRQPSEPYLQRAKRDTESWQQQLQSTSQPASDAKLTTKP